MCNCKCTAGVPSHEEIKAAEGGATIKKTDGGFSVDISLRPGEVYYLVCAQSPTMVEHAHKLTGDGSKLVMVERINEIRL